MKDGFEELMKRFPKSEWNRNAYASYACMANDRTKFLELWRKVGKQPIRAAWSGGWTPEVCSQKFFERS